LYRSPDPVKKRRQSAIVEILLDSDGTDIKEVVGEQQDTILHIAASYGHNELTRELVAKGANIHARNIR